MRPMTAGRTSPSIDRRRVGALLRKWREQQDIKAKHAAAHIKVDATTLGRIERGAHGVGRDKISQLMDLYGVRDEAALNELVRAATEDPTKQWWYPYRDLITPQYLDFVTLESQAASVQTASVLGLPGLLQCPAYAQEMQETAKFAGLYEQSDTFQRVRMARQQVITRSARSAQVQAMFSEGALLVGSSVMQEQIAHMIALSRRANVDIRIIPFSAPLTMHSFVTYEILNFSHPWATTLHLDSMFGGMLTDEANQVDCMAEAFSFTWDNALSVEETREMLTKRLRETEE